uniref:Putative ribonuclease H-like domain-containing protein n=1 Tax=Tanacetum cinerariifolium TaxID=118510 RepID=A0A6L2M9J7_TANCI|nr:putative ribonuclease H-like domain-containing protein [Tanacetum cinerariifolium]
MGALATIQEGNKCTEETKAKADVFLHQHIDEMLEFEYSNCDDPSTLWKDLEIRFNNQREVLLSFARDEWNNLRLGHPRSTMTKRIVKNTYGHPLKDQKFSKMDKVPLCTSCSFRKPIVRPSPLKIENKSPMFLERIQGDICGLIHPPCGPFRYFMVLIDVSYRWSHVSLLSTRNVAFAKFLAQIIKLWAHFPDYTVKRVRLDNAREFTSHAFNDYCMSIGIVVEHLVAYVHTQNGLAKSLIKPLQLIATPMIMKTKLPVSMWGHAILHAALFIRMRPSAYHKYSLIQLASGQEPNISHLRIFGCAVYVPIAPPQCTKMGPQRRLGIYVGYETSSIIRYIEPLTGDVFTARFVDCYFIEAIFPPLSKEKETHKKDVSWSEPSLLYLDPRTKQSETEVQKIMHLQKIANQLPDAFIDTKRVTKSHIPAANAPTRVELPNKQAGTEKNSDHDENVLDETQDIKTSPKEEMNDMNKEMSINYIQTNTLWDRNEIRDIDEMFSYYVASDIMSGDVDLEPKSKTTSGFVIIAVYVDDLNIIGTNKEINEVIMYLKEEFEMKDLGYLSDPHKARSQTGYVFLNGGTAISWRSQRQTLIATSSNHAKVIALHEASRECVWLSSMTQLIVTSCGLNKEKSPTIIHEDNAAYVAQMKEGYIKSDRTKHIPPRYFAYTQYLIKGNQIEMKYVQSSNNSADLFTKALLTFVFRKHATGMQHVQKT